MATVPLPQKAYSFEYSLLSATLHNCSALVDRHRKYGNFRPDKVKALVSTDGDNDFATLHCGNVYLLVASNRSCVNIVCREHLYKRLLSLLIFRKYNRAVKSLFQSGNILNKHRSVTCTAVGNGTS